GISEPHDCGIVKSELLQDLAGVRAEAKVGLAFLARRLGEVYHRRMAPVLSVGALVSQVGALSRHHEADPAGVWILMQEAPMAHMVGLNAAEIGTGQQDRKSTRLNSSHVAISYAVFCLKKK